MQNSGHDYEYDALEGRLKVVAFIFARGGSKGLPGKNIRLFGGKPLIAWSIEHAMSVSRIEQIYVSTDSEEIAAVAKHYGASVPFIRPAELAQDDSPEWRAWQHALDYLKKVDGFYPDAMVSVPTTAPLRQSIDIENCWDEFEKGVVDEVITVTDAHRNPYFNMVKKGSDGSVELIVPLFKPTSRRQDAPVVYDMTTVAYVLRPDFIMQNNRIFDGRVRAVHVPKDRSIDIDTLLDFYVAECLQRLQGKLA